MADKPIKITFTLLPPDSPLLTAAYYLQWALQQPQIPGQDLITKYATLFNIGPDDINKLKQNIIAAAEASTRLAEETQKKQEEEKKKEVAPAKPTEAPVPAPATPPKQPTVKPELIIARTKYPKWWNDEGIAKIALDSPGSQFVVTARGDYSLYIATIVLTVSGECDIIFAFGQAGSSGTMHFGGENEPRGIVIAAGNSPTPCGSGSFMVTATSAEAVSIGGFVSYYLWKKE